MIRARSRAREVAMQLLVQYETNPQVKRLVITRFAHDRLSNDELEAFCLRLYDGTVRFLDELDRQLSSVSQNWRLNRMAVVDRNVLRLGLFEITRMPDLATPAPVVIDEMIELAKRFGSKDSPSFINGILDRFAKPAPLAAVPPTE
ncbi:transcription antitermination factor NusB [Tuwongella immobilis]|uniref:Transcription antitermination protein NusB n=1 Tax=Tuwongella immobilis TaxID=692036 RepID=A0A6C2YNM9_9BACT|nr:transcription antitermination factor NusB [Tuwongella immobilis]VIP03228.1 transcription antitermination protein : N utilization substance protein B homolog OS=Planctomyces brasiliensis (strain ATCC 49424 / DSM 5305 / JCM 21570 / NBRC 103401 / IFAM 1448) GN=nusB PE=3 SV=1: NusB [Tuwongella immobilis]VTS03771.1 transcription antitermination protein : N utilization substance protein B homolog OS=Planctomyces brasiliensis (strain ATCC 49424 / DSM 5305 / JCM 21570 / NBRC 103401 / IFAM 1448) GN=nus